MSEVGAVPLCPTSSDWARRSILDAVYRPRGHDQVGAVALAKTVCRRGTVLCVGDQDYLVVWVDRVECAGELDGERTCFCDLWVGCLTDVDLWVV